MVVRFFVSVVVDFFDVVVVTGSSFSFSDSVEAILVNREELNIQQSLEKGFSRILCFSLVDKLVNRFILISPGVSK